MRILWHDWTRVWWHAWIIIISMILMWILSFYTSWNSSSSKPLVDNIYPTMIIWRKLAGMRPMSTSFMTTTIKTQLYTKHTWMMGGRVAGTISIPTYTITINTLSIVVKGSVDDLLRHNSTSCTIKPTITSLIFLNTIINMSIRTRYRQQSTMDTWVMGVRVASMGPISTSPITTNSFYYITRGKVDVIFRPGSKYVIINSYITHWVAIITSSIYPPITIIKTDITILFLMNIFIYTTRKRWRVNNILQSPGLYE